MSEQTNAVEQIARALADETEADEDYAVRAEVGECTAASDHESAPWGQCIHCGAELGVEEET